MATNPSLYRLYPRELRPWLHLDQRALLTHYPRPDEPMAGTLCTIVGCDAILVPSGPYPLYMVIVLDGDPKQIEHRAIPIALTGLN